MCTPPHAVCEEKFVTKHVATIGIDFGVKPVNLKGEAVRINFFDMAGGDQYRDIRVEFYKDAQGVLLVFDVNNKGTFDALENWLVEAEANGLNNPAMVRRACDPRPGPTESIDRLLVSAHAASSA